MKSLLCGLFALSIAGVAIGQTPLPQVPTTSPAWQNQLQQFQQNATNYTPAQLGMPVSSVPVTGVPQPQAPSAAPLGYVPQPLAPSAAPYAYGMSLQVPADCCPPALQKICVPEPAIKTITHICYSKICTEFCLPKCSCFSCLSSCGLCPTCEGPMTKYFLVKKVRTETCDTFKCTPTTVPACGVLVPSHVELIPIQPKAK